MFRGSNVFYIVGKEIKYYPISFVLGKITYQEVTIGTGQPPFSFAVRWIRYWCQGFRCATIAPEIWGLTVTLLKLISPHKRYCQPTMTLNLCNE